MVVAERPQVQRYELVVGEIIRPQGSHVETASVTYQQQIEPVAPSGSKTEQLAETTPDFPAKQPISYPKSPATDEDRALRDPRMLIFLNQNPGKNSHDFMRLHYPPHRQTKQATLGEPSTFGAIRFARRVLQKDPYTLLRGKDISGHIEIMASKAKTKTLKIKDATARHFPTIPLEHSLFLLQNQSGMLKDLIGSDPQLTRTIVDLTESRAIRALGDTQGKLTEPAMPMDVQDATTAKFLITPNGGRVSVDPVTPFSSS